MLTFGGTKNGLLGGEAVVFLRPELARRAMYLRKQVTQLPSKMRFVAAQFLALLADDRWLELAGHANAMAGTLHTARRRATRRRCRAARRSTACSPSCRPSSSSRSGVELLLGLGRQPPPGPLDDGVGHDGRRRRSASSPA